ncbi:MAG: response regulator [Gemmatimonadales bacterium]|jgi:two-component system, cell cycle sensor histidine kinase and response regulator CckA
MQHTTNSNRPAHLRRAGSEGPRNTPTENERLEASRADKDRPLVLIVDDHGPLLQMMARWLAQEGYELLLASDARAALDLVERAGRHLSAAVVDVRLPGLDGPGLVRVLRHRRTGLPVLYITGYAEDEQQRQLRDPVLTKPFVPEQLAGRVRNMLGGSNRPNSTDPM